jgi:RimJ/RimL family protein N-acetyltransferase
VGYADLFPPDALGAAVDVRRRMWIGLIGDSHLQGTVLVSEQEGRVGGFIHFGPGTNDGDGEIFGFYVHPDFWGQGGATALMDNAIASLATAFPAAVLWTHVGAARARRFYAKSDWSETGNRRQESLWDGLVFPALEYQRLLGPG